MEIKVATVCQGNVAVCPQGESEWEKNILSYRSLSGHCTYPKLCNINLRNITHSLISRNPGERMFIVQTSFLTVTFLSLISQILSLMQTTIEVNLHPHIAPCVDMWSITVFFFFFFLCHLLNVGHIVTYATSSGRSSGVDHTNGGERRMDSNFIVSHATLIL